MAAFPLCVARVYDPPEAWVGARLLVDRLWPRGVAKARLRLDDWLKEVAPSTGLRQWFHADPARWAQFRLRYLDELGSNPAVETCLDWCRKGPVTLLTASRDRDHNHADILHDHLDGLLRK